GGGKPFRLAHRVTDRVEVQLGPFHTGGNAVHHPSLRLVCAVLAAQVESGARSGSTHPVRAASDSITPVEYAVRRMVIGQARMTTSTASASVLPGGSVVTVSRTRCRKKSVIVS